MLPHVFLRRLGIRRSFSSSRSAKHPLVAEVLEQRTLLSADFAITADALLLDGFTQVADENLTLRENGTSYEFVLSEGVWNGSDGSGVSGSGTGTLSVAKSTVAGLAGGIDIDGSAISVDVAIQTADFSTLTGGLDVSGAGAATVGVGQTVTVAEVDVSAISFFIAGTLSGAAGPITVSASRNIELAENSSISTTIGAIWLSANLSGAETGLDGVKIDGATISTEKGAVTIEGRGGDSADRTSGVLINGAAQILSMGTAANDVTIRGSVINGIARLGVYITGDDTDSGGPVIESATGDIVIEGTITNATGNAILIGGSASIISTGTGADAALISIAGEFHHGVTGRGVLLAQSTIRSIDGDISVSGTGFITGETIGVNLWPTASIESTGIGADAANISITGIVETNAPALGHQRGVEIVTNSAVRTRDGDISISGRADDTGVNIVASAISALGVNADGTVTITGSAASGYGISISSSMLEVTNGALALTGIGGGYGVTLGSSQLVSSRGAINISGTSSLFGAKLLDTAITSAEGDISIVGRATGDATAYLHGVWLDRDTSIISTGTGLDAAKITIEGYAGSVESPGRWAEGLSIFGSLGVAIGSVDGNILMHGEAFGSQDGSAYGVRISSVEIMSSGTGPDAANVIITGTSAGGGNPGAGLSISFDSGSSVDINSIDGDISIVGEAEGASPDGDTSLSYVNGVELFAGTIDAAGSGHVVISGTGPFGSGERYVSGGVSGSGVYIAGSTQVSATGGGVEISGSVPHREGRNSGGKGVEIVENAVVSNSNGGHISLTGIGDNAPDVLIASTVSTFGGGDILISSDSLLVTAIGIIDAGTADVVITPRTAGRSIALGGADTATALGLTDAELDRITAGRLIIGDAATGDIVLVAPITQGTGYLSLSLISGGVVVDAGADESALITVDQLSVSADAVGVVGNGDIDLAVSSFTADVTGVLFTEQTGPLTLGSLAASQVGIVVHGALTIDATATLDLSRLDLSAAFASTVEYPLIQVDDPAAVVGTFAGLPEDSVVGTYNGRPVKITYVGGDGNDVVIYHDHAPLADDDGFPVVETGNVQGNLLTNDSDPDSDPLVVSAVNGDPSAVGQTITLVSGALLTVNADGSFTYDPNGAFVRLRRGETATETFTYTISDGVGGSATATVTLTIYGGGNEADLVGYFGGEWRVGASNGAAFDSSAWATWSDKNWSALKQGDFNGDGLTDVLGLLNGSWWVGISNGSSFVTSRWAAWSNLDWQNVSVGDLDHDGDDDVVASYRGSWWVGLSDGTSFLTPTRWTGWSDKPWQHVSLPDLDGDGDADLLGNLNGAWWASLSTGSGFETATRWGAWDNLEWDAVGHFDANGDEQADVYAFSRGSWYVGISNGSSFTISLRSMWKDADWVDALTGDFNDDGYGDVAARLGGSWWVSLSDETGEAGATSNWGTWNNSDWRDVTVGDFDGDGRDDIAGRSNGQWWVARSTGAGFMTSYWGVWENMAWTAIAPVEASNPAVTLPMESVKATQTASEQSALALLWSSTDDDEFAATLLAM